jgi:hypothetical protein
MKGSDNKMLSASERLFNLMNALADDLEKVPPDIFDDNEVDLVSAADRVRTLLSNAIKHKNIVSSDGKSVSIEVDRKSVVIKGCTIRGGNSY